MLFFVFLWLFWLLVVAVVFVIIVGPTNLTLKFGQNMTINSWYVIVVAVLFVDGDGVVCFGCWSKNLSWKFGQNWVSKFEFVVVNGGLVVGGVQSNFCVKPNLD